MKTKDKNKAALDAFKKGRRDEEIAQHGKTINHFHVQKSKRTYTRKLKHKGHRLLGLN